MSLNTLTRPRPAFAQPADIEPLSTLPDESLRAAAATAQPVPEAADSHADRLAADFVTDRFFDRPAKSKNKAKTKAATATTTPTGDDSAAEQTAGQAAGDIDILEQLAHLSRERVGWLRTRETVVTLLLWLIMLYPMAVVINSFGPQPLWDFIYYWDYSQGSVFQTYCLAVLIGGLLVVTIGSTIFLLRNNYNERHGYARHATYDEIKAAARNQLMEDIYSERFGPAARRHSTQAIRVRPEQNLPDHFVAERFEEAGLSL